MSQGGLRFEDASADSSSGEAPAGDSSRMRWVVLALVALVAAVYARTVAFGFTDDDYILARDWSVDDLAGAFHGPFDQVGYLDAYFRPLSSLSFALEWQVWGTSRWGYHLGNIALHTVATLGVWSVLHRLRLAWWAAFIGAAYFAIVPSNAATVVYIAQRTDAMVAICICVGLGFVWRWFESRDRRWLLGLAAIYVVALLAKEIAVALVPMSAVAFVYLRVERDGPGPAASDDDGVLAHWGSEARVWWRGVIARPTEWIELMAPLVGVTGVYLVYRTAVMPSGSLGGRYAETQHPVRALVGGFNSVFKGVPWELSALPWAPLVLAFVVGFVLRPRSRVWRVVVLGLGSIVGGVVPLTFSGGVEPRLLYVAQIGLAIAVAGLVTVYGEAIATSTSGARTRVIGVAAVLAVLVSGAVLVSQFRAQNLFGPDSDRQLRGELQVWTDPAASVVPAENLAVIEQNLREAGLIDDEGRPTTSSD